LCICIVVFFFQAEDGIRDFHVTGVQTCALPISGVSKAESAYPYKHFASTGEFVMTIDLSPLYRHTIGYDRFASLLDTALRGEPVGSTYPPYNIEVIEEDRYAITLAVAGFSRD